MPSPQQTRAAGNIAHVAINWAGEVWEFRFMSEGPSTGMTCQKDAEVWISVLDVGIPFAQSCISSEAQPETRNSSQEL